MVPAAKQRALQHGFENTPDDARMMMASGGLVWRLCCNFRRRPADNVKERSELEQRLRRHLKPTNKSWRVDETYVRVKGRLVCKNVSGLLVERSSWPRALKLVAVFAASLHILHP